MPVSLLFFLKHIRPWNGWLEKAPTDKCNQNQAFIDLTVALQLTNGNICWILITIIISLHIYLLLVYRLFIFDTVLQSHIWLRLWTINFFSLILKLLFLLSTDLDSGEFKALKNLFKAEKVLFGNNLPQVLMAHAASSLCANFDLTIDLFDGLAIPVLIGHPVSGKSTALKAVLSVFRNYQLVNSES